MTQLAVALPSRRTGIRELVGDIVTAAVVVGTTAFIFAQLRPDLLFAKTTDVGGDNAAHVAATYYFVHSLLPHFQLSGWDPEWFGGFPLYVFYFPLPAVLAGALSIVVPLSVAFKLVTVLGTLLLPLSAYLFGRLAGFSRPVPALMSVAMVGFAFNTSYTIDGGNLASTLAGEFSFSLAVDVALVFLGSVIFSLRTGRRRWLAPLLFAATLLCHVVPALFAAATAAIMIAIWPNRTRALRSVAAIGIIGALVSAFWLLRFAVDLPYSSSMGYLRVPGLYANLLPRSAERIVQAFALLGALFGIYRGQRVITMLSLSAVGSALAFAYLPSGLVYNGRWLPFWFLTTGLIAAYGLSEAASLLLGFAGFRYLNETAVPGIAALATLGVTAAYLGVLPGYHTSQQSQSFLPSWVAWNYTGYQRKPGWQNFESVISMLDRTAKRYGCGTLDYEYSPNFNNAYGSPLVPMSFPMWTKGCIGSAEGVYYESSTTTPFHFLDQSELSIEPSNPVVGIPYQGFNVQDGIRHLQLMGVRYFLANSLQVELAADADPALVRVASTPAYPTAVEPSSHVADLHPQWVLYRIRHSVLVRPLSYLPEVETGLSRTAWLKTAISWYQTERDWPVALATQGPAAWPRIADGQLVTPQEAKRIAPTTVQSVRTTDSSISFTVSRIGVPVLVNIPFFPNWSATGATGPYLGSPNMMIVVPDRHRVSLTYGATATDWEGRALSLLGLVAIGWLIKAQEGDPGGPTAPFRPILRLLAAAQARRERERRRDRELGTEGDELGLPIAGPTRSALVTGPEAAAPVALGPTDESEG